MLVTQIKGITQKHNCKLMPLDWQQEQALMSAVSIGYNGIEINRNFTTSACAAFIPFTTQELFNPGWDALYYGRNALSNNLNLFNHRTNVDIENRLVCFDIKEVGTNLRKLAMLIVQDQVWNRVSANRGEKSTRYYIDEFHLLLKEAQTAAYSVEIWKRFRKWGGIPTGLTQNVKDLLASKEIENIFDNSDFVIMLNQAAGDREILAQKLGISQAQIGYVKNARQGSGLLFFGDVILPFVDDFPKDTKLYSLMTTKPEEQQTA